MKKNKHKSVQLMSYQGHMCISSLICKAADLRFLEYLGCRLHVFFCVCVCMCVGGGFV